MSVCSSCYSAPLWGELSPPVLKKRAKRSERSGTGGRLSSKNGHAPSVVDNIGFKTRGVAHSFTIANLWSLATIWRASSFFFAMNSWIGSCNIDLDPAICGGGRRPRSTAGGGRSQRLAKGRDATDGSRRPASGRVEPAEHEAPVQRGANSGTSIATPLQCGRPKRPGLLVS